MVNKTPKKRNKNDMAPKSYSKSNTKKIPSPSPPPPSPSPYDFEPGTLVEISSDEYGFRGSWYTGTVIRRCSSKNPAKYLVQYHKIFEDDAGKLPVKQVFECGQLRPLPPAEKVRDFKFGEEVDAFYNDGWWEGNVVEERAQDGMFGVFFMSTKEKIFFRKEDLRLHREWVCGKWKPAPEEENPVGEEEERQQEEGDSLEPERVEELQMTLKVRPPGAAGDEMFSTGMPIEVSSDEEGFEGAWFPATIVKVLKGGMYLVQYKSLRTEDDSDFLKEEVDSGHIRPCPPETVMIDRFKLLEEVDALYNDCWWVGVVARLYVDSKYVVYFRDTEEELVFKHSDLRPHLDWINGKWVAASKVLQV